MPPQTVLPLILNNSATRKWTAPFFTCLLLSSGLLVTGCEKKPEKIIDLETPHTKVEVKRNQDTGKVEVEVDRTKPVTPAK